MKSTILAPVAWWLFAIMLALPVFAEDEDGLELDEYVDSFIYFGDYARRTQLTGYGTGGYGDPQYANFDLNTCQPGQTSYCTSVVPDTRIAEWRFIPNIGWRKFSAYGAMRKDWWDYKKTVRWPFNWFVKNGYNW